jgi:hypothetical protein
VSYEQTYTPPVPRAARNYPDWIAAFVATFDSKTESPTRLLFWTAVAAVGGAVTRHCHIDEKVFKLFPNWYIVFVAPPGQLNKSTTINYGIDILRDLPHVYLSADCTTYPAFIRDLAAQQKEMRSKITDDGADDEWVLQCAVTAPISEFGTFFKPEDEDMVNGLTDLWDCRNLIVKDTKTSGTDVLEHPFVNLIAGTTTKWIKDKVKEQLGGWGLSSRIIFVYEEKKTKFIARPGEMWGPGEYEQTTRKLLEDLKQISNLEGPMTFSPAANALTHSWYDDHQRRIQAHNKDEDADAWLGYFLARKQAHVHKLAMVLSLSRRSTLVIEEDDFLDALREVEAVEAEVPFIFKHVQQPTSLALTERSCLEKIMKLLEPPPHQCLRSDAFNRCSRTVDSGTLNRIIDNAIARGALKQLIASGVAWLKL